MREQRNEKNFINRRGFLALGGITAAALSGVMAEAPAAHARPEIPLEPPKPEIAPSLGEQLRSKWQETIGKRDGSIDIAMIDNTTGLFVQFSNDGAAHNTASIIKLAILEQLLLVNPDYARQKIDYIRPMITESNNNVAIDLWEKIGGQKSMQAFFHDTLGVSAMTSAGIGPFGTVTTAADQLKVVNAAIFPGVLSPEKTAFATDMLRQVIPGQRWGISAGLPADVAFENKNGWTSTVQNSIGHIHGHGLDYTLAVLAGDAGISHNRQTTELLAIDTWQIMSQPR